MNFGRFGFKNSRVKATVFSFCLVVLMLVEMSTNGHAQSTDSFRKRFLEFKARADQGDAVAQINLGICYATGRGVDKDDQEALKWIRKAAEQNHAGAQNNLGICCANGEGVKTEPVEAYSWYTLAARTNEGAAKNREVLAKAMSPQQLADAEKRIKELRAIIDEKRGLPR
ncbi:MAG: sel1 repeat family protein [Opitutaceae bacterium]|nr:sel1 repeat family protein [Verrucomicrobiales bacterium]